MTLAAMPDYIQADLRKRNLPDALIEEMQLTPMTPDSDAQFLPCYPKCDHGFYIPYPNVPPQHGKQYARKRNLDDLPVNEKGDPVKYSSPAGEPSHLYWLPIDGKKLASAKAADLHVESEIKAAVVSWYVRPLDTDTVKYAVIGGGGVDNFRGAPEFRTLKARDRKHYIVFDADANTNPNVRNAAHRLAAALVRRGASFRNILVLRWPLERGKGIDDFLLSLPESDRTPTLQRLIQEAAPLMKALPIDLESAVWAYALSNLAAAHISMIAEALIRQYKKDGVKKSDIEGQLKRTIARKEKAAQKQGDIDPDAPKGEATQIAEFLLQMGTEFTWDTLHDRIFAGREPMSDPLAAHIYCHLVDKGVKSKVLVDNTLMALAFRRQFHPVKDYLNGLTWDHASHISKLASYFDDVDGVFALYLRRWLIGAARRVFERYQNPVLVLVGPQRMGKGHFCKWLASGLSSDYYIESPICPGHNDHKIRLTEKWIWEASEFGVTVRKSDVEALKSFLTLETVTYRRPYGHYDMVKDAMASVIGTINPNGDGFLNDPTGNLRYRPVTLTNIRREYATRCNVHQVWAEAVAAYRQGESAALTPDEEAALVKHILPQHEQVSLMQELVAAYFSHTEQDADRLTRLDILNYLEFLGLKRRNDTLDGTELSGCMKKLGFEKFESAGKRGFKGILPCDEKSYFGFLAWQKRKNASDAHEKTTRS